MQELTPRTIRLVLGSGILGVTLLGACAYGRLAPAERQGLRRSVPIGSTLELLRSLSVPAGDWSVYFQNGSLLGFGRVELSRPYCELYLGGVKSEPWQVEPGVFVVTATRSEESEIANRIPQGIALAALRETWAYETVLVLRSDVQPEVRELRCRVEYEAGFAACPTVGLIRHVVGGFFHLTLASSEGAPANSGAF